MSWQQYVDDQLLATKQVEKSHPLELLVLISVIIMISILIISNIIS